MFDYNMATKARELKKRQEIPSGFDATKYEVRRHMAPARDGVQVPVSILMQKGAPLDGSSPLLLYAYGSYGATTEPTFNSNVLSLVDRGIIYAIAHIRGGQEMGRAVVRRREDDEEEEHVLRLHRRRRVPGEERLHASRIVSSPTAAAPAGC